MAASYTFEDLSGTTTPSGTTSSNPYDALIESCHSSSSEIQSRYATHRIARGKQQRALLSSSDFQGVTIDATLHKLSTQEGYVDPRNCLVFWARPPPAVIELITSIQTRLKALVPRLWLMPKDNLHMTALEITHSLTAAEISTFVDQLAPVARSVIDFPFSHRARLIKPRLELDAQALALSFLPASGGEGDEYTYHHLRRDLYSLCTEAGVKVASRYVVPSAHLTIARFVFDEDFGRGEGFDHGLMQRLVALVEEINGSLEREYWPSLDGEEVKSGGQWIVGEGKGLDHRRGTLWYGGGETIVLGKGF